MMNWRLIQDVPCLSPNGSWERLHPGHVQVIDIFTLALISILHIHILYYEYLLILRIYDIYG